MSRQENLTTATHVGTSAHFSKPTRFSGKDLTSLVGRSQLLLGRQLEQPWNGQYQNQLGRVTPYLDKALDWHMAEVRHYDVDAPTAWTSYSKALKARFTDPGADAKNYNGC
ncbi:hypothetical protein E4U14_008290 [Claviceps sp. LM454 group G7]|nr:hypothetical protein E4U14_008290 [Claviceps sp. LM454 group G7]